MFTVGTKEIVVKKHRGGHGHHNNSNNSNSGPDYESSGGNRRRNKAPVRISIKDSRPVSLNAASLDLHLPGVAAVNEDEVGDSVNLSLAEATGQRRRIVEVRQRQTREAEQNARRYSQSTSQASGFNTSRGQRRALIVLPKSEEKMAAREKLMQMHPHIAQVFRGLNPPDTFTQEPFNRILTAEAPTMPYRRRNMEVKSVVQWGERKLFLLDLEFLSQYGIRPGTLAVYVNCCPATRIPFLAQLFPHVNFLLFDPTPLDFDETQFPNVKVRQEAFTDAIAREIHEDAHRAGSEKTLLFIANATFDTPLGFISGSENEVHVTEQKAISKTSMDDQARWYHLLKPAKAMLKFSLPWTDDSTYYLDGDIVLPAWNPPTSTETRLIPNEHNRTWNHRHYEEQMFYFNSVTRVSLHEHGVEAEGLDGCYDCTSEVFILERYLERYPHMLPVAAGSQIAIVPAASGPAVQLKFDSTKFKDPQWLEKQKARKAQFLITLVAENDGQPLTIQQMADADAEFEQKEKADADMETSDSNANDQMQETPSAEPAAAAAAAAGTSSSPAAGSMDDAAPTHELSPLELLKLNVGKFSQELSRRITNNGTRTLATLNAIAIKKAAFTRKK